MNMRDGGTYLNLKIFQKSIIKKYLRIENMQSLIKELIKKKLNSFNLSTSGDFSNCSVADIKRKIKFLKLDNIVLIKGPLNQL